MTAPTPCTPRWFGPLTAETWRAVVLPKEHGSWSLAFEPVALGLLAALGGPMLAAGAMALSSVTVVLNALRLGRT